MGLNIGTLVFKMQKEDLGLLKKCVEEVTQSRKLLKYVADNYQSLVNIHENYKLEEIIEIHDFYCELELAYTKRYEKEAP